MDSANIIDLTADDDVVVLIDLSRSATLSDSVNSILADLDNFDLNESDLDEAQSGQQQQQQPSLRRRHQDTAAVRNSPIVGPNQVVDQYHHNGHIFRQNETVELLDGSFLIVRKIIVNPFTGSAFTRGNLIQRTRFLGGGLMKKLNECALTLEVELDDRREPIEQSTVDVDISRFVRVRAVRFTNCSFPGYRMIQGGFTEDEAQYLAVHGGLAVRWVVISYYQNAHDRQQGKLKERVLRRLTVEESSAGYAVPDLRLQKAWRGAQDGRAQQAQQKYNFVDAFCGAGGASRGAQMAGLSIISGFDFDKLATEAWSKNFPHATSCCLAADEFISMWKAMPDEIVSIV